MKVRFPPPLTAAVAAMAKMREVQLDENFREPPSLKYGIEKPSQSAAAV